MILENGRIHTLDPALPTMAGLPITRDGLVAKGVEAWEGDSSAVTPERVDLQGCTVVPGLVDAHVHLRSWALSRDEIDLSACRAIGECTAAVADAIARDAPRRGGFLIGHGWRQDVLADGREPHRHDLDVVAGERPVALWAHDRHTLWLSTAALDALGIDRAPDVPGGVVEAGGHGVATGIVREEAAWQLPLPAASRAEELAAVQRAMRAALARGVTSVHDFDGARSFSLLQELDVARSLRLRVASAIRAEHLDGALATGLFGGFGSELLRVGPVKAFLDGTLGSRTARMLEPYADGTGSGLQIASRAELRAIVERASGAGLRVAVHAIGDAANRDALDVLAETRPLWSGRGLLPRIEHAQLLHPDDLPRVGALGIVASVQPAHLPTDRDAAELAWGGARCAGAYAWRSLAAGGAVLAFGSDAPIEPLDPLLALHVAVNRTADERPPFGPGEALDVRAALAALTTGPARAAGWERIGTLGPHRAADLVVLDGDPFTCPPERLREIRVVATMVAGRFVHGREALVR